MLDHLQARNNSILAHGFEPLNEEALQRFAGWVEGKLLPLMLSITDDRKKYRISHLPEQLPNCFPAV